MSPSERKQDNSNGVRPVRVRIYYDILETIREQGDFIINGRVVPGVRNYYYSSGIWLTWKLPRSKKKLLASLQKWKWRLPGIDYDHSKMDLESRHQDHYTDFDEKSKPITYYDNFHGREATIVTEISNKSGPNQIKVFFNNGEEKEIKIGQRSRVIKEIERLLV
jgi:hypothetical protein